jgi:hypothetical protein
VRLRLNQTLPADQQGVNGSMARRNIVTEQSLRHEVQEFQDRFPKLKENELFVLWFLRAFVTEEERIAASSLCGGSGDKGLDAVYIDDHAKIVFVIQGKYRRGIRVHAENRNDVMALANLASILSGDAAIFNAYLTKIAGDVQPLVSEARKKIKNGSYRLQLYFVTTGRCSPGLLEEAERHAKNAPVEASFILFDGRRVLLLLADYLDGVAPPVPSLDLPIEFGKSGHTSGVLQRYDKDTDIESWIFSMTGDAVSDLYDRAGLRLFARNVRGFLENTEINRRMEGTLSEEPEHFWYYNNGITVICDHAERVSSRGHDLLRVTNPQVINGQQTTRTLARHRKEGRAASVLVRVIRVPRDGNGAGGRFEALVSQIVLATNSQNAVKPSDLMANDRRQIEIERELRKLEYGYIRKRQTKGEAKRIASDT